MTNRRRVSLQSFRELLHAEEETSGPGDFETFAVATIPLAIWYWIAGVPRTPGDDDLDDLDDDEPEPDAGGL
jgi:hypothetical protein